MTVLQIVKALAAEEDINWGDSDTTFSRQTKTGSIVSVHYIDSKSIPANTLGGYVDTHLHTQNTDTGTTQTTFEINSGGSGATLSSSGLSANRTFTFPDASQALVGATNLASTASGAGYGAKTVGVYDSAGNFTGTEVETCLAENAAAIAAKYNPRGYKHGFTLGWGSASTITISGGMWNHYGSTDQMVYRITSMTYTPSGLSGTQLQYIYLDDSAIVASGSTAITTSEITNSTNAPSWSDVRMGWYYGSDRCIGAIYVSGGNIVRFKLFSDDYYCYHNGGSAVVAYSAASSPVVDTSLDFSEYIPAFSTRCSIAIQHSTTGDQISFKPATGWPATAQVSVDDANEYQDALIDLDTDQTALWVTDTSDTTVIAVHGYYAGDL